MGISPKEIHMETLKELQDICNERSKSQGLKRRRLDKKVQKICQVWENRKLPGKCRVFADIIIECIISGNSLPEIQQHSPSKYTAQYYAQDRFQNACNDVCRYYHDYCCLPFQIGGSYEQYRAEAELVRRLNEIGGLHRSSIHSDEWLYPNKTSLVNCCFRPVKGVF